MQHISFVMWMVLYPLSSAIGDFVIVKKRILRSQSLDISDMETYVGIVELLVYIIVAFKIW